MSDRSNWPVHVYRTPEDADRADDEFYAQLTPQERIALMFEIIGDNDPERRLDRIPRITKRPQS
jgi:hypothetical protein